MSLNQSISMHILPMTAVPQRHTCVRRIIHGPQNVDGVETGRLLPPRKRPPQLVFETHL